MKPESRESGFTLIELVLVVVIIGIIGTLATTRIESIGAWKHESDIRRFANLWETLQQHAFTKGDGYRLIVDLDDNSYTVRREVPLDPGEIRQVDYLKNLRTKGEQERRAKEEEEEQLKSLDEEFLEEDQRRSGALDRLYYQATYRDPELDVRLAVPLEFPEMAKSQRLTLGLKIRDIIVEGKLIDSRRAVIRFSPRRLSQLAVVHFLADESVYTMAVHPASGKVRIFSKDITFEEAFSDWIKPS